MKPKCKSESSWKFWRRENPNNKVDHFGRWAKQQMKRARRRFERKIQPYEYDEWV